MTRLEALFFNAAGALTALSGAAYFVLKYLMTTDDPFAVVNHPLEPWAQAAHVLFGPLFLLSAGILIHGHVKGMLRSRSRRKRRSGLTMLATGAILIASGYLLQVLTAPFLRQVCLVAHLGSAFLSLLLYAVHRWFSRPRANPAPRGSAAGRDRRNG